MSVISNALMCGREYRSDDLWVKRVIGLPGETISYREGVLYVDGNKVAEPFLDKSYVEQVKSRTNTKYFTQDYTSEKLGRDEYLLVGDNRNESLDSRNEAVGPFKREQIIARGVFVYKPFSKARYVGNGG
ncbi:MAG: signal peptidase I [Clostridium sp.]